MLIKIILLPLMAFSTILRLMPLSLFGFFGRCLGALLRLVGFRTRIVESNLKLAFANEKSPMELKQLQKKVFSHVGTLFLEIARNFTLGRGQMISELNVDPADIEKLDAMKARGEGAVFISAHIANWELFACGMAARGYPVSIIGKRMSNPVSQELIAQRRINTGIQLIYSGGTIEKMKEALKIGGMIGFMVDQHMPGPRGIRANFFGAPAASIRGLAGLARDTNCKIIPMCAFRKPDGTHFVKMLEPLPFLQAEDLPAGSEERWLREEWLNTQNYQAAIEKLVRQHPEQWLWIHRRWKADKTPLNFATAHLQQVKGK